MNRFIHLLLLFIALFFVACNSSSDSPSQLDPDTSAESTAATVVVQPTVQPVEESVVPSTATTSELRTLTSYRLQATITDQETGQITEMNTEGVVEPIALHTISSGPDGRTEMIVVDNAMWLYMPPAGWYKTDFTEAEMSLTPAELMAEMEDMEDMEMPDIPPPPAEIQFLPGQMPLPLMEGGLTLAGTEHINGVECRKYAVETLYSYEMEMPMMGQMATSITATGFIWVADTNDLPPIIMQADIEETDATSIDGQETITQRHIVQQVTAFNTPITIVPPEGAVGLDEFIVGMGEEATPDNEPVAASQPTSDLSNLDSYRLERAIAIIGEGYESTSTHLFEWVKEPYTYRLVMDMGMGMGEIEHLWTEDGVWLRMDGGDWMAISADEAPDPFAELSDAFEWDDEMTLVGAETVNGVNCQRYMVDLAMPELNVNGRHDVWVADQNDLPPLFIRSILYMEQPGMTTAIESNLYDINQPIIIAPPN